MKTLMTTFLCALALLVGCDPTDPNSPNYDPDAMEEGEPPTTTQFVEIQTGVCWLTTEGELGCSISGPGYGTDEVPSGDGWVQISGSFSLRSACALHEDHSVTCWGEDAPEIPDGEYRTIYACHSAVCTEDLDRNIVSHPADLYS